MAGISPLGSQVGSSAASVSRNADATQSAQANPSTQGQAAPAGQAEGNLPNVQSLMQLLDQMTAQKKSKPKGSLAKSYLKEVGLFKPRPLEKQVSVRQSDDSAYWSALGYEA
ncbi:MAG TPA: hypothetical protein V6C52_09245 [Coleofasciculaceae cyanobacterium]|jgi:hypothetical protein